MELLLVFPNLNLFSHEKKLSSSSRRTNHSDKTMNNIHSRLRYSISKGAKCSRGKAGLRDRNLGVWPNSAFIICSRASEMSGRVLIPKVSPMECTDHRVFTRHRLAWVDGTWKSARNSPIEVITPSINVCPACCSWWAVSSWASQLIFGNNSFLTCEIRLLKQISFKKSNFCFGERITGTIFSVSQFSIVVYCLYTTENGIIIQ